MSTINYPWITDKFFGFKLIYVPNLRFPLFIDNWIKYRISDLLETYPTNSLSWDQLSYDISNLKNIHYGLIHNGFETTCIDVKSDLIPYIKPAYYPKKYTLLKIGDLILADASEDREDVGKSIEIIEEVKQKTISGLHTIHARDKVNFIINGFKGFYFKSKPMKEQIFKIANGSKIYGITSSNFNELYMCIPGKLEQERIVSLMMKIEQRIQTQIKIIEAYSSLMNSICVQLISKKDENTTIEQCLNCNCSTIKESDLNETDYGNYPVYGANGYIRSICTYQEDKTSIGIIKDGAGVGKIQKLKGKYSILCTMNYLTAKDHYNIDYLFYALKTKSLKKYVVGSGIPHIYFRDYKLEKLYIPNDATKINKIVALLDSINDYIGIEKEHLDRLNKTKKYLLKNMFC